MFTALYYLDRPARIFYMNKTEIIIHSIKTAIKNRGLIKTLQMIIIAVLDEIEDKRRGIIAHNFVDSAQETQGHPSSAFANFYQPVRTLPFKVLMKKLNVDKSSHFVDIGSGTGKALILALEFGFKKAIGVELVKSLCAVANTNKKNLNISDEAMEIYCMDALKYDFQPNDRVVFLNDPFSDEIFAPFLEKLKIHAQQNKTLLIYKNNNLRPIPSVQNLMKEFPSQNLDIWGNFFHIVELS